MATPRALLHRLDQRLNCSQFALNKCKRFASTNTLQTMDVTAPDVFSNDANGNKASNHKGSVEGFMMLKDESCPWWTPDPKTGIWSFEGHYDKESSLNILDQHVWIRSEEA